MSDSPVATLVADVVLSRAHPDRSALHSRIMRAITAVQQRRPALRAPAVTVGDEYQAIYDDVGSALAAAYDVRLTLLPEVELRVGIGFGTVTVLGDEPGATDGPGWWDARAAIEHVERAQQRSVSRTLRTAFCSSDPTAPDPAAVQSAVGCLDALIADLDDRGLRLLSGLRAGLTGRDLAEAEGISASAVSQRVGAGHLGVITEALEHLQHVGADHPEGGRRPLLWAP